MSEIVLLTGLAVTGRLYRSMGGAQLAWWLRQSNYDVQVIDFFCQMSDEDLLKLYAKFITKRTRIVGFGIMGTYNPMMGQLVRFVEEMMPTLRKKFPHVIFVCGGACAQLASKRYTQGSGFDYYYYGYAENTFLSLCNQVFRKGSQVDVERKLGNRIIRESTICPLDESSLFTIKRDGHRWHDKDCIMPNESLPIEIGRGCIFKCKFCAFPHVGKKKDEYTRTLQHLEEEILNNYYKFGSTKYYLLDDTFNDDVDKIKDFSDMVQRLPFKIHIAGFCRADLLWANPDTPHLLEEAGMIGTYFGIESFNQCASKFVGKPWSFQHAQDYLIKLRHEIWKERISFRTSMIIGLPGDDRKDYIKWHRWFVENEIPNWSWHPLHLERDLRAQNNSTIDKDAEKHGYTWITENSKVMWKHKESGMTWRDAMEMYTEFEALKAPYQVKHCWGAIEEFNYLPPDADPQDHNFVKVRTQHNKQLNEDRKTFLNGYIRKLLAL